MSDMLPPVRVGIIGLGRMGQNHLRVLSLLSGAEIAFVYDVDQAHAAALGAQAGVPAATNLDTALERVDAVVIASPTVTHDDYARLAARYVDNIFVEKPVTDRLDTSESLRELVRERGLNLQVGFIERFNPALQELRRR